MNRGPSCDAGLFSHLAPSAPCLPSRILNIPSPTIFQVARRGCPAAEVPLRVRSCLSGCGLSAADEPGICLGPGCRSKHSVLVGPTFWGQDGHQTGPDSIEGKRRGDN